MRKGGFIDLAEDYTKYCPSYNKDLLDIIIHSVGKKPETIKPSDIGAGTGIFKKCLIDIGVNSVIAF